MSESWQDWRDPTFLEFLETFYRRLWEHAKTTILPEVKGVMVYPNEFIPIAIAVFEKVAPPAVYLKAEYDRWLHDDTAVPEREQPTATKTDERWRTSRNPTIEWMPEQEATEQEMIAAMDPANKDTWYREPSNGYTHGSIFRRKEAT